MGDDAAGTGLVAELGAAGVTPAVRVVAGAATGTIVSLVEPGGQRSMLADRGANLALAADDVVKGAMPGRLYKVFEHYKRDEWERYLAAVTDWEREEYLEVLP